MLLDSLVQQVNVIEKMMIELRYAMRHASPHSVNELRKQVEELEGVYEELMESCVVSNFDLEYMLGEHDECLRDCFRPSYTGKPVILPKPQWDIPPPPVKVPPLPTVPGVNLILYIDTTGSMTGSLSRTGKLRSELEAFANYLKSESTRANIPCTVSLVWFGDAMEDGANHTKQYFTISMNKESVVNLPAKIAAPIWYRGGASIPESGILAMKESLGQVHKVGVANTLIYVSDAPPKENEFGATFAQVKSMFNTLAIKAYGILPYKAPSITTMFLDTREFTKTPYNITPWANSTLRP